MVSVRTNGIVVIDFLTNEEPKTGNSVFHSAIKPTWTDCANCFYYHAPSKEEFFSVLRGIRNAARDQDYSPILHIESHGNEWGISNGGNQFISWTELKPFLQEINRYSGFNLLVVMSACEGAYLMRAVDTTDSAMAWAILGPKAIAQVDDLVSDFSRFYRSFLTTFDFGEAFKILNCGQSEGEASYQAASAEFFFHAVFGLYLATEGKAASLHQRATRVMSRAPSVHGAGKRAVGLMRKKLINQMQDHRAYFDKYKRVYFMEDTHPGMSERFEVSYEKALAIARAQESR